MKKHFLLMEKNECWNSNYNFQNKINENSSIYGDSFSGQHQRSIMESKMGCVINFIEDSEILVTPSILDNGIGVS